MKEVNNKLMKTTHLPIKTNLDVNMSIEDALNKLKNSMLQRCQDEVPSLADFAKVKESIKNLDKNYYAGEMSLVCEPVDKNSAMRYLTFFQLNPQNKRGLSCILAAGTKEEILEKLNDENFIEILKDSSQRISQKMRDLRW